MVVSGWNLLSCHGDSLLLHNLSMGHNTVNNNIGNQNQNQKQLTVFRTTFTDATCSYINLCEKFCLPNKTIIRHNNHKPWFSKQFRDSGTTENRHSVMLRAHGCIQAGYTDPEEGHPICKGIQIQSGAWLKRLRPWRRLEHTQDNPSLLLRPCSKPSPGSTPFTLGW